MSTVCCAKYCHVKYFACLPLSLIKKRKSQSVSWPCQTFLVDNKGGPSALWQQPSVDLITHDPINTVNKLSQLCRCRPISNLCHLTDDVGVSDNTQIRSYFHELKAARCTLPGEWRRNWCVFRQRSHGVVTWRVLTMNVCTSKGRPVDVRCNHVHGAFSCVPIYSGSC